MKRLAIFAAFLLLAGCTNPLTVNHDTRLVGTWQTTHGTDQYRADGSYVVDRDLMLTYKIIGDSLEICNQFVCDGYKKIK